MLVVLEALRIASQREHIAVLLRVANLVSCSWLGPQKHDRADTCPAQVVGVDGNALEKLAVSLLY